MEHRDNNDGIDKWQYLRKDVGLIVYTSENTFNGLIIEVNPLIYSDGPSAIRRFSGLCGSGSIVSGYRA